MALAPKFAGQAFSAGASHKAVHTIELYLDYVCPFSAKMFNTLYHHVFTTLPTPPRVQFILRQQIQPWHPSSTLVHEAAAAVLRLKSEKFWEYSAELFARQKEFFDASVVNETRNKTYERLAELAGTVGVDQGSMFQMLAISDRPGPDGGLNSGNAVTDDVKLMVKANRLTGVHVTPTVLFNGIVDNSISSSFTPEDWWEWLEKNVV